MKFRYYLEQITDVSIYPIVSLLLFVAFFTIVTLWVFSTSKQTIEEAERLPLD